MFYDLTKPILDEDDKPFVTKDAPEDEAREITLSEAAWKSVRQKMQGDPDDYEFAKKMGKLAQKLRKEAAKCELSAEEVSTIQKRIAKMYGVFPLCSWIGEYLENNGTKE